MKFYIPLIPNSKNEENCMEVSTNYELGGYNYWNGQTNGRGYYLHALPCLRETNRLSNGQEYTTVTQTLGKGFKICVKEVLRRSKKAEAEAERNACKQIVFLVKQVCEKYEIELECDSIEDFIKPYIIPEA